MNQQVPLVTTPSDKDLLLSKELGHSHSQAACMPASQRPSHLFQEPRLPPHGLSPLNLLRWEVQGYMFPTPQSQQSKHPRVIHTGAQYARDLPPVQCLGQTCGSKKYGLLFLSLLELTTLGC